MENIGVQTESESESIESLNEIMESFDLSDHARNLEAESRGGRECYFLGPSDPRYKDKRVQDLEAENQILKSELASLKKSLLESSLNENFLEYNESFVRSLTGLPTYGVLQCVLSYGTDNLQNNSYENTLPIFKEYLLTMMKIKMGVSFKDLATRFRIDKDTATTIFCTWLDILYPGLQPLVTWPHRDHMLSMRSTGFKYIFHAEIAIIIDVIEVYIEKPCLYGAETATYSEEKQRHVGKYLVAYTPDGTLVFVSTGWGGNTPFDDIVQKCGVLDQLLPNDIVFTQNGIMKLTHEKKLMRIDAQTEHTMLNLGMDFKELFGAIRNFYSIFYAEEIPAEFLNQHVNNLCRLDQIAMIAGCLYNFSGELGYLYSRLRRM